MPPRGFTNPAPKTDSARAQLNNFYCALCGKGYSRQNEFAAHEASYEHNHNQRRKDLKSMNIAMSKTTSKERDGSDGLMKVKPISLGAKKEGISGAGFKKSGFKSAFGKAEEPETVKKSEAPAAVPLKEDVKMSGAQDSESEDDWTDCYDPRRPTGCGPSCKAPG